MEKERSKNLGLRKIGGRKTGGRNNTGRITVRHRGGGHKRMIRELEREERTGKVLRIEYDPNRTAYLGVCSTYGGRSVYKIMGQGQGIGSEIRVTEIGKIGVGEEVYKVGIREGQQGKMGRASGVSCKIVKQGEEKTVVRLPSKEVKEVSSRSICTIGSVMEERKPRAKKAGATRRRGIRPSVRGVAMNPIDHPHGGKTPSGQPRTPWGKLAK